MDDFTENRKGMIKSVGSFEKTIRGRLYPCIIVTLVHLRKIEWDCTLNAIILQKVLNFIWNATISRLSHAGAKPVLNQSPT